MSDPQLKRPVTPRQPTDPLDTKTPVLQKFARAQREALHGLKLTPSTAPEK